MSRFADIGKTERQWKHVYESARDAGKSDAEAKRIASAVVNKHRAKRARSGGPKLIKQGGTRRGWYPGKKSAMGKRETFACLKHKRKFKTKAGMLSHFRGRLHGRKARRK